MFFCLTAGEILLVGLGWICDHAGRKGWGRYEDFGRGKGFNPEGSVPSLLQT